MADGYGYDNRVQPQKKHYAYIFFYRMVKLYDGFWSDVTRCGSNEKIWKHNGFMDLHSRKPKKVFDVPGAPLEIRCAWGSNNNYCFTTTALTSKLWLIYEDKKGEWQAEAVADIGDPSKVPLPVDISITSDDKGLWIDTFMDGKARYFDISDPHN